MSQTTDIKDNRNESDINISVTQHEKYKKQKKNIHTYYNLLSFM